MITNSKLGRKLRCMNITKMNKKKAPLIPQKGETPLLRRGCGRRTLYELYNFKNFINLKKQPT